MMQHIILGLIVAFATFGFMQFVVQRLRAYTLVALIITVGAGLSAALFLDESVRSIYQFGWMLGMMLCVAMFLFARGLKRAAEKNKPKR